MATPLVKNRPTALPSGAVITLIDGSGVAGDRPALRQLRGAKAAATPEIVPGLNAAMARQDVKLQDEVSVNFSPQTKRTELRGPGRKRGAQIRYTAPPPPPGYEQVVLYCAPGKSLSWHLPSTPAAPAPVKKPRAKLRGTVKPATGATFIIPARVPPAQRGALRGKITKLFRGVLKVVLIPIASKIIGKPLQFLVGKIERHYVRNNVRFLTPQNYLTAVDYPFPDWPSLDGKRTLLVIHGIFSSSEGMLHGLPLPVMKALHQQYDGRVIALDQVTVSDSPKDNAKFFLEQAQAAQPNGKFEFDILCHSRGGIVARTLVELGKQLVPGHPCTFRKVFFVATPNSGSALGDGPHMVEMLDTFTSLLTAFPDGVATYTIEIILGILKLLVYTGEKRLPGLADMGTQGFIPKELNRPGQKSPADYAAAAANYQPDPNAIERKLITGPLANHLLDRVFQQHNDLVVPTLGVYGANGHASFPISKALVFSETDYIWHGGFFSEPRAIQAIMDHFELKWDGSSLKKSRPNLRTRKSAPTRGSKATKAVRVPAKARATSKGAPRARKPAGQKAGRP